MGMTIRTLLQRQEDLIERELEAADMAEEGRVFDAVMHQLNEGLTANAFVECQMRAAALNDAEKGVIIAKFVELDMLDEARRLRYRWKLADSLPAALNDVLSTRPRREDE